MTDRLKGKRIIITGAVSNIGKEAVRQFVAEGARVVIGDRDAAGADTAAEFGPAVSFIQVDVTSEESVRNLIEKGAEWLGGVDVLAQNAGMQHSGAVTEFDASKWDALFAVNSRAHFFGAKYAIPLLRKNGGGSIINIASVASSVIAAPNRFVYGATKAGVIGMSKAVAADFINQGIRCNVICPGTIESPSLDHRMREQGDYEVAKAAFIERQPMGRLGKAEEVAALVIHLASDESAFTTDTPTPCSPPDTL